MSARKGRSRIVGLDPVWWLVDPTSNSLIGNNEWGMSLDEAYQLVEELLA